MSFTGEAIADFEKKFNINDSLSGIVSLTIENGDVLPADTPLIVAIIKEKENSVAETLTLEEFIQKSDNPVNSVEIDGKKYFNQERKYSVELSQLLVYNFNEKGNYQLLFDVPSIDLKIERVISVE